MNKLASKTSILEWQGGEGFGSIMDQMFLHVIVTVRVFLKVLLHEKGQPASLWHWSNGSFWWPGLGGFRNILGISNRGQATGQIANIDYINSWRKMFLRVEADSEWRTLKSFVLPDTLFTSWIQWGFEIWPFKIWKRFKKRSFEGQISNGRALAIALAIVPNISKQDHLKSGIFCPDYKWFFDKMWAICPDFKKLGFRI